MLALLALLASLASICLLCYGCAGEAGDPLPGDATPDIGIEKAPFADLKDNWAWVIVDWGGDIPGGQVAATSYASPDRLDKLAWAASAEELASVRYTGEKASTAESGDGYLFFDSLSGPVWEVPQPLAGDAYDMVLLPESCRRGLLPLTPGYTEVLWENGYETNGYPAADPGDVAAAEALIDNRAVVHSELLATDGQGGRVGLFLFENTDETEDALLLLICFRGDRNVYMEFTAPLYDGRASWRPDAEEESIGLFQVKLLCETDAGLVIGFSWYGTEGVGQFLLLEDEGNFVEFITGEWYYDPWEGQFTYAEWA
ncbi:MAG: hypothetical protein FWE59_04985 [Oscillospiraceae bacterium]|nr:hypothetical protein [Oscillospiraceae bacterium]